MKKIILSITAILFAAGIGIASAQEPSALDSVRYPVAELGGCKNQSECKIFCDKPENIDNCLNFAATQKIMSDKEVQMAKKFKSLRGPGGCSAKDECNAYCDDMAHINECVAFAEQNGLLPPDQLADAKKVQAAIAKGVKPPACSGKAECDIYCNDAAHMEECMAFAQAAGMISPEESQDVQKMLAALRKGAKAPKCKGKTECDAYCRQPQNREECMAFAQAAGFMAAGEAANANKTGPGGCKGKEECDAFCSKPENQQTCMQFGGQNGAAPPDTRGILPGMNGPKEALGQASPEALACLQGSLGADAVEQIKNGSRMPTQAEGEKMKTCLSAGSPPEPRNTANDNSANGPKQTGPGGCSSPAECDAYCQAHREECANFGPGPENMPQPMQPQMPPGPPNPPMPQSPEPQNSQTGGINLQSLLGSLIQSFMSLVTKK